MDTNNQLVKAQSHAAQSILQPFFQLNVLYLHTIAQYTDARILSAALRALENRRKMSNGQGREPQKCWCKCVFSDPVHTQKLQNYIYKISYRALRLTHCFFHSPIPYNNVMYLASECSRYIWLQ